MNDDSLYRLCTVLAVIQGLLGIAILALCVARVLVS